MGTRERAAFLLREMIKRGYEKEISTSDLRRLIITTLNVSYSRASQIMYELEALGVIERKNQRVFEIHPSALKGGE